MKKTLIILLVIAVIIIAAQFIIKYKGTIYAPSINSFEECAAKYPVLESYPLQCKTPDGRTFVQDVGNELDKQNLIKITSPRPNDSIKSPLTITGEARGTWYFEASFPVKIYDANNKLLGTTVATAQSDWMTENFVPFTATLEFSAPATKTGTLVLQKDNPSGLAEKDDSLRIPVRFDNISESTNRSIKLYYYNPDNDSDSSGNVLCSRKGLVAVNREIPITQTPIQDALDLLLKGELTSAEQNSGIMTEFPLAGVELKGASLSNKVLTLEFADPQNKTSGGSCRASILWFQIEATAKQFSGVNSVKFIPDALFQP